MDNGGFLIGSLATGVALGLGSPGGAFALAAVSCLGALVAALALPKDRAVVADGATDGATVADPRALAPDAAVNGQSLLGCACKCSPRRRPVDFFR